MISLGLWRHGLDLSWSWATAWHERMRVVRGDLAFNVHSGCSTGFIILPSVAMFTSVSMTDCLKSRVLRRVAFRHARLYTDR